MCMILFAGWTTRKSLWMVTRVEVEKYEAVGWIGWVQYTLMSDKTFTWLASFGEEFDVFNTTW